MIYLVNLLFTVICLGINQPGRSNVEYRNLALSLNPDCWHNWSFSKDDFTSSTFTPSIWKLTDSKIAQAAEFAKSNPGKIWLLYNEPEGSDQANVTPDIALNFVSTAIEKIKASDPTAKIACCGVMLRQEGINWIDKYLSLGGKLPDYWHVHIYAVDVKGWNTAIDYWHWWNENKGSNLPTLITETCGMYSNNQAELLNHVLHYQHPEVKAIYWFSAFHEPNVSSWNCGLFDENYKLTNLGNIYKSNKLPNKLTPTAEPPTPTKTPFPVITLQPLTTVTPTITPTITPTSTPIPVDETTGEIGGVEPLHFTWYFPIILN